MNNTGGRRILVRAAFAAFTPLQIVSRAAAAVFLRLWPQLMEAAGGGMVVLVTSLTLNNQSLDFLKYEATL